MGENKRLKYQSNLTGNYSMDNGKEFNKGFKAYDGELFLRACALGMNEAVAFMVLCCGTGRDKSTTSWSAKSIASYGGMGRGNAKKAIDSLLENGIISLSDKGTRNKPRYKVNINKDNEEWVWIPNSVIMGVTDVETGELSASPLAQIKKERNIDLLKVFFFLYKHHFLDSDGGISRELVYNQVEEVHLGGWGSCRFYRAIPKAMIVNKAHDMFQEINIEPERFAELLDCLVKRYKLIDEVCYVFESDGFDSDILYTAGGKEDIDNEVIEEVRAYFDRMDNELDGSFISQYDDSSMLENVIDEVKYRDRGGIEEARVMDWDIIPISKYMEQAHAIGVYRLRFRPNTTATSEWFKHIKKGNRDMIKLLSVK